MSSIMQLSKGTKTSNVTIPVCPWGRFDYMSRKYNSNSLVTLQHVDPAVSQLFLWPESGRNLHLLGSLACHSDFSLNPLHSLRQLFGKWWSDEELSRWQEEALGQWRSVNKALNAGASFHTQPCNNYNSLVHTATQKRWHVFSCSSS